MIGFGKVNLNAYNNILASVRAARHPRDGHTLAKVIPAIETLIGSMLERIFVDTGYRGNNAPPHTASKSSPPARERILRHP
jgi:hypothetical protein